MPEKTSDMLDLPPEIGKALNDVRQTLDDLSTWAKTPDISDQITARNKAHYQLSLALDMIESFRRPDLAPVRWSTFAEQVREEFDES